ncbi:MAG: DUF4065 domain-containing protein [Magnetovibrio sp.]|nr:DUF4065 domain-containing protein [Magnetovibrio sp.]
MAHVYDVARYILEQKPGITAMKLQKLVYYSQAWSLVWDEAPLFPQSIKAWANGPVVGTLYGCHRGHFSVMPDMFPVQSPQEITGAQGDTIQRVLEFYGDQTAQWLSDLTHMEDPWRKARERAGLADGESGDPEITLADMAEYYSGLMPNESTQ